MNQSRHILPLILLCLPMGLSLSVAGDAAEPQAPPARSQTKVEERVPAAAPTEALRFTNADLPPLRRGDTGAGGEDGEAAVTDGTKKPEAKAGESLDEALASATSEAIQKSIGEARQEVAMLELRLEQLKSRLLSVQNPLLRRMNVESREEEEAVGGASNVERLAWVKEQIAATEDALVAARDRFETLFRR